MTGSIADGVIVGCILASVYCVGGIHGLLMAWSQPARMRRWAGTVERASTRLVEAEEAAARRIAERAQL